MDKTNKTTQPKDYNFMNIKVSLNSSMEKKNIFVTDELVAKTMDRISQQQEAETSSQQSNNTGGWKKQFNFANIVTVTLLFLLIATGIYNNVNKNYSDESAPMREELGHQQVEDQLENNGVLGIAKQEDASDNDTTSISSEERARQDTTFDGGGTNSNLGDSLVISKIINIESNDIDNIEISYYVDNSVVNRDLTNKKDRVFELFNIYPIEEVNVSNYDDWTKKIRVLSGNDIYTILIGNKINIIKEKQSNATGNDKNQDLQDVRAFRMDNATEFIFQLDQIINVE